eukprot:scaffold956_cov18-Tisochrysis_lutea.AAC.2
MQQNKPRMLHYCGTAVQKTTAQRLGCGTDEAAAVILLSLRKGGMLRLVPTATMELAHLMSYILLLFCLEQGVLANAASFYLMKSLPAARPGVNAVVPRHSDSNLELAGQELGAIDGLRGVLKVGAKLVERTVCCHLGVLWAGAARSAEEETSIHTSLSHKQLPTSWSSDSESVSGLDTEQERGTA